LTGARRVAPCRHSIQVEINQRLYRCELPLERRAGFDEVRRTLAEQAEALLGPRTWPVMR
jgi:hypothetical protein